VKVLSRLYRRLFIEGLVRLHKAGKLAFFGDLSKMADPDTFQSHLSPLRKVDWVVYAKPPFGGPEAALAYLSRYTHPVAISNHRLISADARTVAFRWKDYRIKRGDRMKVMRLPTSEFIRRFLIHVLPSGFLANGIRRDRIAKIRQLLSGGPEPDQTPDEATSAECDVQPAHHYGRTPHDQPNPIGLATKRHRTSQCGHLTKSCAASGL